MNWIYFHDERNDDWSTDGSIEFESSRENLTPREVAKILPKKNIHMNMHEDSFSFSDSSASKPDHISQQGEDSRIPVKSTEKIVTKTANKRNSKIEFLFHEESFGRSSYASSL